MRVYLRAAIVTLGAAILFVLAFSYWKEKSFPADAEKKMEVLEGMEKGGLLSIAGKTLDGEAFRLEDFKGKVVILNFWASWCGPCVEEFPSLLKLVEEMKGQVILVAVSGDSEKEDIDKFLKQLKDWQRPWVKIVWDQDHRLADQYDVDKLPESFIAGTRLQLVKKVIGSINWYSPDSVQYLTEILKK